MLNTKDPVGHPLDGCGSNISSRSFEAAYDEWRFLFGVHLLLVAVSIAVTSSVCTA
jgi:hypothetical protein